jgi:transcription-repair coupling factor (superfamily II helicase)
LPEEYVEDGLQRTTLYQKIARLAEFAEAEEMRRELEDRFGPPPAPAHMLLRTVEARIAARKLGAQKAEIRENALVLHFSEAHMPERAELPALATRCKRPSRFLYGTPLQLRVELNPPRRGDAAALTEQAVETLRTLAG